jgi:serine/threonine protein phosphatase PrpC
MGRRREQQDRVVTASFASERDEDGVLAVVADGHGPDGEAAAEISAARIAELVLEAGNRDAETFRQAFLGAHDLLYRKGVTLGGATATCVTVHPDAIVTAWAGNSEARLAAVDGTLTTLAIPHEFGVHRAETARLNAVGAEIDGPGAAWASGCYGSRWQVAPPKRGRVCVGNASLEVTRALGDREFDPMVLHEPEIVARAPTDEDRWIIVATDGVWHAAKRAHKRRRIGDLLSRSTDVGTAAAALEALLKTWKLDDNATFALVDLACIG